MDTLTYKTVSASKETVKKEWFIVDAENEILGRLASKVAQVLRGKLKTSFTPHADCGDYVIVINAEKIKLTGNKLNDKEYVRHTGYPGGQRFSTPKELMAKNPAVIIEKAVKGMLPKNKLASAIYSNLYVYKGTEHPHAAQQPKELKLKSIK